MPGAGSHPPHLLCGRKADIQRQKTHRGMADLIIDLSSEPYIFTPGFYSAGGVQTTSKSPDGVRETFRRFPLTHSRPTVVSWTTSSKERESKKVAFRTASKCGGWFQWCRSRRRLKGSLRPCSPCSLRCAWLRAALDSVVTENRWRH